jgi:hypothetical protein
MKTKWTNGWNGDEIYISVSDVDLETATKKMKLQWDNSVLKVMNESFRITVHPSHYQYEENGESVFSFRMTKEKL